MVSVSSLLAAVLHALALGPASPRAGVELTLRFADPFPPSSFPRLCTEILSSDSPSFTDVLFHHDVASSQPDTCPAPLDFLLPFWCASSASLDICEELQLTR